MRNITTTEKDYYLLYFYALLKEGDNLTTHKIKKTLREDFPVLEELYVGDMRMLRIQRSNLSCHYNDSDINLYTTFEGNRWTGNEDSRALVQDNPELFEALKQGDIEEYQNGVTVLFNNVARRGVRSIGPNSNPTVRQAIEAEYEAEETAPSTVYVYDGITANVDEVLSDPKYLK